MNETTEDVRFFDIMSPLYGQAVRVGSRVRHGNFDGATRTGTITAFGEKNDRDLAELDNGKWAYLDQIEFILIY